MDTGNYHTEDPQHAEYLEHGAAGDEPFFKDVGDAVQRCAEETEEVAFEFVNAIAAVCALEVVGREQDAHSTATDQDADDLWNLVAHFKDEE